MKAMRRNCCGIFAALLLVLLLPTHTAAEETDSGQIYRMVSEDGTYITSRAGKMYAGDEYIAANNDLYVILSVDEKTFTATARTAGKEPQDNPVAVQFAFSAQAEEVKKICMYSTHSDESYISGDGESSLLKGAGIYDVGNALKENLEKLGVEVTYSEETFHPHDAGAYRRSRAEAEELLKQSPDALIDIHRDAIDASEYETEIDGEETCMVRLFVGKTNENAAENRAFAKTIKANADAEYPGFIKDIYIGKGNYNQDLYPKAILLEFGSHKSEKEQVIESTGYMANVLNNVLFGDAASAETTKKEEGSAAATGIIWVVAIAIVGAILYALVATGTFKGIGKKLGRGTSQLSGGLFGKKPKDGDS